uniref:PDZ domain-containing protein n=1 Tax=Chrysemys picta bellii TaxID=8478 RepID=A0A8C3IKT9_CHRPI
MVGWAPGRDGVSPAPSVAELREFGLDEGHSASLNSSLSGLSMVSLISLVKDANGLGFSLDGGRGSLQGDRPLTVKKIFQGERPGGAEQLPDLLQPGDEVLQIGERSLQGLMRLEAWQLIRALPVGPVQLLVRKKGKP